MSPPSTRPQRLFVTGGRGRLAALIADHFAAPEHEVALFSRTPGGGMRDLRELAAPQTLAGADTVLHLAWSTLPATAEQTDGTADLAWLEGFLPALAAVPAPVRPHLVFFSSGGAVYGNAPGRPSRETDACHPPGRYGQAKLAAENLILAAARAHDLPCTILRISNPYGYPVPRGRAQGIIPHAVRCAVEGQPLSLWGDGQARKDFLHHTDFLAGLREVIARRLTGLYNLAAGESHTVNEIIALVEQHTGRKLALERSPAPSWDVQDSRLDPARLREATGWRPRISLSEGIRRLAASQRTPA
jgi:UDP-glucose 4-epimerase